MPLPRLLQRCSRYTNSSLDFVAGLGNSIAKSSLSAQTSAYFLNYGKRVMEHGHRYTNRLALIAEMRNTIANSSLPTQTSTILKNYGKRVMEFFKQPHIRKLFLAHGITFMAVFIFLASLGFGSVGVGGGTLAAAFQSILYGGLTPAGGLFATLTSMGMLGTLLPVFAGIAAVCATLVTACWCTTLRNA